MEALEIDKDRARVLLNRYGVVFRHLLEREHPAFVWRPIFQALRLMELAGEVVLGFFFDSELGLQFVFSEYLTRLNHDPPTSRIFWMNAMDPASPCGLPLMDERLPPRVPSNYLVFKGSQLMSVFQLASKSLTLMVQPGHPDQDELFGPLRHLLGRKVRPLARLEIELINGKPARKSPWLSILRALFRAETDHRGAVLYS